MNGLKDVSVKIPTAVTPGDTVSLYCQYDLENEPLYTVKWYKGRQEFYRYIPKELPNIKVFPLPDVPGFTVDVSIIIINVFIISKIHYSEFIPCLKSSIQPTLKLWTEIFRDKIFP